MAIITDRPAFIRGNVAAGCAQTHTCPSGYVQRSGDIKGWGAVNGIGGGQHVAGCSTCASLCDREVGCLSYECSPVELRCNLNAAADPTPGSVNWEDQVFCSNSVLTPLREEGSSLSNDVVLIQSYYDGTFIGGEYGGVMGVSKGAYGGTFGYKQDRARKFEVQRKANVCRYQDHLDHVTFRDAVDGYGWAVPVVTNRDYFVNFDSKVDFQSMKIEWGNSFYLINYGQEDESVKLKWPYVNYRYRFDVAPAFKAPSNLADYVTGEKSADTCPFGSFRLPRDECMRAAKAVSPRVVGG